jgi:EAL domain-containing protein (putative c-di-GMP-specific phosphodiesterase class I)
VEDFEQARASLFMLRSLGVRIALDDFGTGYSSLSHVHLLPLDRIKIDRSFIEHIETESMSHNLVASVIQLCGNLNIACVIEGVETERQAEILQEMNCATMQGYFFGRPMPREQALHVLGLEKARERIRQLHKQLEPDAEFANEQDDVVRLEGHAA